MTARQAVHHLFENGLTSYRLDGFLDAYAHELAEKQRDHAEVEWAGSDARMILRRHVRPDTSPT